ncbi:hypothetical protein [Jeotgalibaca caeni]|uniref:hypothetical protein n=1 Tax=Jeotgalibaca caeni TaxID=3028623 RepID=UPI00237E0A2D|nr:hypothetical protein [Jeotgalibaca caeni]MDE1548125.1 hypothetical protein [Jeotgalibaca caeni]
MQEIYFQPVNPTNEKEVRKMKVKPEQRTFIETVDECLAEAAQRLASPCTDCSDQIVIRGLTAFN